MTHWVLMLLKSVSMGKLNLYTGILDFEIGNPQERYVDYPLVSLNILVFTSGLQGSLRVRLLSP